MLTLTEIRQRVGVELGAFFSGTATDGSNRYALEDTSYPSKSNFPGGGETDFSAWWVFRPEADTANDQQRRVQLYEPRTGIYTPDAYWAVAPAEGEAYELWNVGLGLAQLHRAINDGLKRLYQTDRLWVVPDAALTSERRVGLPPDVTWLTNPLWVQGVAVQREGRKTTASLSASMSAALANHSANVIFTWKRDRSLSGIRRRQLATNAALFAGTSLAATWATATRAGNTCFAFLTTIGGTVTAPAGWSLLTSVLQSTTRTSIYYVTGVNAARSGAETFTLSSSSIGTLTLLEYDGLLPNGLDTSTTSGANASTLSTGTTSTVAEADELWLGIIGTAAGPTLFNPSNRFELINGASAHSSSHPAYHWIYERICPVTNLDEQPAQEIRAGQMDAIREEGGGIYFYPDRPVGNGEAYLIDALRPLSTYCAVDATGMLGTKLDGLTAEGNVTDGSDSEEVFEAIVNAAIVAALTNYPQFREWTLKSDRQERIREAQAKMAAYNRSSHPLRRRTFVYQEPVG